MAKSKPLNSNETKIIIFLTKSKKISKIFYFRLSGKKIEIVKQTIYLGIYLDHLN